MAKLNAAGTALVYSTYLGGSSTEYGYDIAVDGAGQAYVTGETASTNFPTAQPLQPARDGSQDAFVAKLNAAGTALVYSTYLGGSSTEYGYGIALDTAGQAYVMGWTASSNFPTAQPLQPAYGGGSDAFVAKIDDTPGNGPDISVDSSTLDFRTVTVGRSKTKTFHIRNAGDIDLDITEITGDAPPFELLEPMPPFTIEPGQTVDVQVRFTPTKRGKISQTLVIHSDDPDEPEVQVILTGKGKAERR